MPLPPAIRAIARDCIEQHVNEETLARTQSVEDAERDTLATLIETMPGGGRR